MTLNQQPLQYFGHQAGLATMHGKELVVAPAFLDLLGIRVVRSGVDTDQFGTFSGDIPRKLSALETAQAKARAAIEEAGIPLGIASEGTIGPHPMFPIASSDLEIMVFIDAANDLVIHESVRSSQVVTARKLVRVGENLDSFLQSADFPNHGLLVRSEEPENKLAIKGITDLATLKTAIAELAEQGKVVVESDLRAHFSPSRMRVIAECARLLAARVASQCPRCEAPGFGKIQPIFGLPCIDCGENVETVVLADRMGCVKCNHTVIVERGLENAEARFCSACNP
jgi:hypothetical protein